MSIWIVKLVRRSIKYGSIMLETFGMIEVKGREKHMESRSYTWCFQHFIAKWFSLRFLGKWGRWFFNFWSTLIMVSRKNRINGWWGNFHEGTFLHWQYSAWLIFGETTWRASRIQKTRNYKKMWRDGGRESMRRFKDGPRNQSFCLKNECYGAHA